MSGSNLTDEELRQAAAEAGISPQELRIALAERGSTALDKPSRITSLVGPPTRGQTSTHVEGQLGLPPRDALGAVRSSIERQIGKRGHNQGENEADIVDDDVGVTYRLRAADDGAGGALVRVDIDGSSSKGGQALQTTGVVGVTATLIALGWLFGATTLWLGGLGIGVLGGLLIFRNAFKLRRGTSSAHAVAAHALMEAEDRADASR